MKIRAKFTGVLLLAAGVPLAVAFWAAMQVGERRLLQAEGTLLRTQAAHLSASVALALLSESDRVRDWAALTHLHQWIPAAPTPPSAAEIEAIEARWPWLDGSTEPLARILDNPASKELREFRDFNPLYAEILMTDRHGALVAATGKTTDYWQADEEWWQVCATGDIRTLWLDGIHYDASAGVHSIDIGVAVVDPDGSGREPVGMLKAVLRARPLLQPFGRLLGGDAPRAFLMDTGGRILFDFGPPGMALPPPGPEVAARITTLAHGHGRVEFASGESYVCGTVPVSLRFSDDRVLEPKGVRRMHLVVARDAQQVLVPIHSQTRMLMAWGIGLLAACLIGGLIVADRHIIGPMERLRDAAEQMSRWTEAQSHLARAGTAHRVAAPSVEAIERVRTGDEIEALAHAFGTMARRVIGYQDQLEREIAAKTAEIRRDLQFARDFQRSLLPGKYPRIGSGSAPALRFHHIYRPASAVSGDFYDIRPLSDSAAAIFVADVMGHGARSALATAILAALVQEFVTDASDPARFLSQVNRQFHGVVKGGEDFLFVTAFLLALDTRDGTARWASAGHPAPFIGSRTTGRTGALFENLPACPALGLLPDAVYSNHVVAVPEDAVLLLFTDGLIEAPNASGEEFGRDRALASFRSHLHLEARGIAEGVVADMRRFTGQEHTPDDICVVAVEMVPREEGSEASGELERSAPARA